MHIVEPHPDPSTGGAWRREFLPAGTRLLLTAAVVVIVLGMIAAILALAAHQSERAQSIEAMGIRARAAAVDVERFLQEQINTLRAISAAPAVVSRDIPAMKEYLNRVAADVGGWEAGIGFIDSNGIVQVLSGYDGPPVDVSTREYTRVVLETGRPYVSEALVGLIDPFPLLILAVPAPSLDGAPDGVLAAGIRLDRITDRSWTLRFAGASEVLIVDRAGQLIVQGGPTTTLETVDYLPWYANARASGSGVLVDVPAPFADVPHVVGYATVASGDWLVLVDATSAATFGRADRTLAVELTVILLVMGASLIALALAWRRTQSTAEQLEVAYAAEREARARTEAAMARAETLVAELRDRERLREAFVGMLSHELRTPVTTIYGAAKLLARPNGDGDRHGLVDDIEEEADRLHRIIEDLLVLSRAERGLLELNLEPVLLQRVVPQVVEDVRRRHPSAPIEIDQPPDLPPAMSDPGPLRQVLYNLLVNAARYGEGAPIRIILRPEEQVLNVTVEDDGPGFPASEADDLFDLFYRSEATSRRAAGTGIGLYVVRQLVLAMNGSVTAESPVAGGARFVVRIPIARGITERGGDGPEGAGQERQTAAAR